MPSWILVVHEESKLDRFKTILYSWCVPLWSNVMEQCSR